MMLKYCVCCGKPLVRISTKTATYKAVCLDCEVTLKLAEDGNGNELIRVAASSPSQMTEAALNKNE